jgi:hypothetical protein
MHPMGEVLFRYSESSVKNVMVALKLHRILTHQVNLSCEGAVLLPAGAGGTIVAGLVIEKLKLSCHQIMKLMTILASATAASTLVFLLFCKTLPFSGVNVSYNST